MTLRMAPLLFLLPACLAAAPVCSLRGSIADSTAAAIPAARVTLEEQVVRSDSQGAFELTGIPCGAWILHVDRTGFAPYATRVQLIPHQIGTLLITLSLLAANQQVDVTADARDIDAQRLSVVPRETLLERSATVLTEIARGELGVHEQRTAPAMGSFFVRGLTGKNVAVYRDGFRYTTSAQRGGVATFQNLLDPNALEAVEFVRGPDSARYGSDSLGGAIHLRSLSSARGEASMLGDTASAGFGGTVLAGAERGIFTGVVHLSARRNNTVDPAQDRDPHSAYERFLGIRWNPGRLPDTAFTQYGGSFHLQTRLAPDHALIAHYERGQQDGAKRYDQLLGGDGNLIADLRNLQLDFGYLRYQAPHWRIGASHNAQREERVNQGGQGNPNGGITHQYEKLRAWGLQAEYDKRVDKHEFVAGVEAYRESMTSPAYTLNPVTALAAASRPRVPDGATYLSHGSYLQDAWRATSRLRWIGSLRFGGATYHAPGDSFTANSLTGRIGASYRATEFLAFRAQYSRGFRVPNMTDLGTLGLQGNGFYEANPNDARLLGATVPRLRPEVTHNVEGGFTLEHARFRLEATAFRIGLNDSIISDTLILPPGAAGRPLGDQIIQQQLPSGAVLVAAASQPVLVRTNLPGARLRGVEQSARLRIHSHFTLRQNFTWIHAADSQTGLPPSIEPGIPAATVNPGLLYTRSRVWVELYGTISARQSRLSSLALADRRIGATRSRANIASFFNNGARVRGLVADGRLLATGETVAQVQQRVLGSADSAPLFTAIPGYGLIGLRGGFALSAKADLFADASNLADHFYRGIGWGIPGTGRSVTVRCRYRW